MRPARRLERRLMLAFAGFVLLVASLFGLFAFAFMYSVEDAFFDTRLRDEATLQLREHARSGQWAVPRDASMRIHADAASLPADLRAQHAAEPWRREFAGSDARHYHVRALDPPAPAARAWLVAEVSSQLVVRPMRDRVFLFLGGAGLLLVATALLLGYWLARRTAAPLSRLAELIDGMAPERLPRHFAQRFANDEIGILARGLDALVERIQAFIAREQEFTRDASHELRTPLAVIRGAAERLAAEAGLTPEGREQVGHARHSALQLEQTVTTLLALAREEAIDSVSERVRVVPVLERVVVEQSPLLEGKPVEVTIDVPHDTDVMLPVSVLHILLSNLVGNAFAHTAVGDVDIDVHDRRLRIRNRDDAGTARLPGPSDPPFSKREGSRGFGLGLAIVRRLCDRHAIDLDLDDTDGRVIASIGLDTGSDCPRRPSPTGRGIEGEGSRGA